MRLIICGLLMLVCLADMPGTRAEVRTTGDASRPGRVVASRMPQQCQPRKTSPEALRWRWKPSTSVSIDYLKNNFSELEKEALSRAVYNWNEALTDSESRVTFVVRAESDVPVTDSAGIEVARGIPRGGERVGEIRFQSIVNGMMRLRMTVSPVVTDLNALTSLMTHELGHSLGLADCYECRRGTTAMAAFKSKNKGNDVYEPSECDKYVVAAGYALQSGGQSQVVRNEPK